MLLENTNPHVLVLCETKIAPGCDVKVRGYTSVTKNRSSSSGGLAILIKDGIDFSLMHLGDLVHEGDDCGIDVVGVDIGLTCNEKKMLSIVAVYASPKGNVDRTEYWRKLLDLSVDNKCIAFLGDMSAHAPMWSLVGSRPNSCGRVLQNAILERDLVFVNDRIPTWWSADLLSESVLDFVITSPHIAVSFDVSVCSNSYGNDHFPVIITNRLQRPKRAACRPRAVTADICWELYVKKIVSGLECVNFEEVSASQHYEIFSDIMKKAFLDSGGKIRVASSVDSSPTSSVWWNARSKAVIARKQKMYRDFVKHPSIENLNKYKEISKECKK